MSGGSSAATAFSSALALFSRSRAEPAGCGGVGRLRFGARLLQARDLVTASVERGEIVAIFLCERRQAVDRRRIFAAHGAQREQPLLAAFEFVRVDGAGLDRLLDRAGRVLQGLDRLVQRLHAGLDQLRRLRHAPLQAARDGKQHRHHRRVAAQMVARLADVGEHLLALHHGLAARRQSLLLAGLDGELGQLRMSVAGEIRLRLGSRDAGALRLEGGRSRAQGREGLAGRGGERVEPAIGVDQRPVRGRIGQRALVVLSVDLDQRGGERAKRLGADALVIDVSPGASVRELHPAQDQFVADLDVLAFQHGVSGVALRQVEDGGHLSLRLAMAHEAAVAARADRQRKRVEEDRLAGPGLPGEDRQAGRELEVEPIDQNHVANGET